MAQFNTFSVLKSCPSQKRGTLPTSKKEGAVGTCVFPFTQSDKTYMSCAELKDYGGVGWCSWDAAYSWNSGRWGYCTSTCPVGKKFIFRLN